MNPYIIGPYGENDSFKFFGREKELECMYRSFQQNDYLVCYAVSGEGKSSILNAGLFPEMRKNKYFPISIRFKFDDELVLDENFDDIVNNAVERAIYAESDTRGYECLTDLIYDTDDVEDQKWQQDFVEKHAWLKFRYSHIEMINDAGEKISLIPVLVFDQFEEVFSNPKSELWTRSFFQWLELFSTDVCPQYLWNTLKERVGEDKLPVIKSAKRFKAVFSLRSEYVAQLDYWGLQYFYIPDLKNNRFLLKSLTPEGARKVVKQPGSLSEISEKECENIIAGCCINEDYLQENLPCVPASILAIVCSELSECEPSKRSSVMNALVEDRNTAVENILEKYYLDILVKCGIESDKERDTLENALVDDKGNRKRVGMRNKELSVFSTEQMAKLVEHRLLRVVRKSDSVEGDVVELPHDKFCHFIMNHKNKRFLELQQKNKKLKEYILFCALSIVLAISAFCLHNRLLSDMPELLSHVMSYKIVEVLRQLKSFMLLGPIDSIPLSSGFIAVMAFLLSSVILTLSIFFSAKDYRKLSVTFSSIGVLSSVFLIIRNGVQIGMYPAFLTVMSLCVFVYILLDIVIKPVKSSSHISCWPLFGAFSLFFFYLLWESVRSLAIGISEPMDSSCFIVLLPILVLLWSKSFFETEHPLLERNIWWNVTGFAVYVILLSILAINNALPYNSPYKLGTLTVDVMLVMVIPLTVIMLWNINSLKRKILVVSLNVLTVLFVYIYSLGYNPLEVSYSRVVRVNNWRSVMVKNNAGVLYGICNPMTGENIIDSVCDTSSDIYGAMIIKSYKKRQEAGKGRFTSPDGSFSGNADSVTARVMSHPVLEEHLFKILKRKEKDESYYSSLLYQNLRQACVAYVVDDSPIHLNEIEGLDELDSLFRNSFDDELEKLSMNVSWGATRQRTPYKLDVLEDSDLRRFYSVITKRFWIFHLKNSVLKNDYPQIFLCLKMSLFVLFPDIPCNDGFLTIHNKTSINDVSKESNVSIAMEDLNERRCFAWYDLFRCLCEMDMSSNGESFQKYCQLKLDENTLKIMLNEMRTFNADLEQYNSRLSQIMSEYDYNEKDAHQLFERLFLFAELQSEYPRLLDKSDSLKRNLKNHLEEACEKDRLQMELDSSFKVFMNSLCGAMSRCLKERPENIYNKSFENVYRKMILVGSFRGYDMSGECKTMREIDSVNNATYKKFDEIERMMSGVQEEMKATLRALKLDKM